MSQTLETNLSPLSHDALATSVSTNATFGLVTVLGLLYGSTEASAFAAAAVAAGLAALSCLCASVTILAAHGGLRAASSGYACGLVGVLVAGVCVEEASVSAPGGPSALVGAVVLLNPLFWVPVYRAGRLLLLRH